MRKALLIFICFACCLAVQGQDSFGYVYGIIKDEDGKALPNATISIVDMPDYGAYSDNQGRFRFKAPAGVLLLIEISGTNRIMQTYSTTLEPGGEYEIDIVLKIMSLPTVEIFETKEREKVGTIDIDPRSIDKIATPGGDFNSILQFSAIGVGTTAGELSSSYVVRGGNFDENLVYVNGFEVYRPFLIRSGQQEGLSFVNGSMVSRVEFSAGGFESKFGDKQASVLDVDYKKPDSFRGSGQISLLGGQAHIEGIVKQKQDTSKSRFTYIFGVRQKSNQYLLNSLETQGEYTPSFIDLQTYLTYDVSDKVELELLGNYARNRFLFVPVDRETTFGVVNNVLRLRMFFEGQERDSYETLMGGFAINHRPNERLKLRWMTSAYNSFEEESFDILAEYFLDEVESDLASDNFGQTRFSLGAGGTQNFARNSLAWSVINAEHQGTFKAERHTVEWGLKYQREIIDDKINEWDRLDSAGYSIPFNTEEVIIDRVLKSTFELNSSRISGYLQNSWRIFEAGNFVFNYGARFTYWDVNKEFLVSPRAQLTYSPAPDEKNVTLTAAVGMYQQPPFYREMRNLEGFVNTDLKAQKSIHAILGADVKFEAWKRKFSFITQIYYKHLYDQVPYEFDNVLIRYFGENRSSGYVAGVDFRLAGEFVKGIDSYLNLSIMNAREDIEGDFYFFAADSAGNAVPIGSEDAEVYGSAFPEQIPRPTDQRFRFTMFFQDELPKTDAIRVHLNMIFAAGLPFGPPDNERFRDTLRIPAYRRVDIGFSAQLFDLKKKSLKKGTIPTGAFKHFESIWLTLEVYNLLGINNTVSYLWVRDIGQTTYAVPNFLSARRVNLRLVVKFGTSKLRQHISGELERRAKEKF